VALSLAACGSSSDPATDLSSQAIDGYLVASEVYCDDIRSEITPITGAAGQFSCPAGSSISKVVNGYDVGTDAAATTGDVPFTGVLKAPSDQPFTTPLTTMAVAMVEANPDLVLDAESYQQAQMTLAEVLNINIDDLSANPVMNLEAAKGNAQVHQLVSAFSPDSGSYEGVTAALALVITEQNGQGSFDLANGSADIMARINQTLASSSTPSLALSPENLIQKTTSVAIAAQSIDEAQTPGRVSQESVKALLDQAPVTIDRSASVVLKNGRDNIGETLSLVDFEDVSRVGGLYTAQLNAGLTRVEYSNAVFQINQDINNARVKFAFEVKSVRTGDPRSITITSDDVVVSAFQGDSSSLRVTMAKGDSTFDFVGTDANGTVTTAVVEAKGETLETDNSAFTIDLDKINRQLSDLDFQDILAESGNFRVTLVISGLRFNERDGNVTAPAEQFSVETSGGTLSGDGFQGYVSVIR